MPQKAAVPHVLPVEPMAQETAMGRIEEIFLVKVGTRHEDRRLGGHLLAPENPRR